MVDNKTIITVCFLIITCQTVIWRLYIRSSSYDGIFKLDGILSDPSIGPNFYSKCPSPVKGNSTNQNAWRNLTLDGGYFKPINCESRETVAVIVPYRNREKHLRAFLDYIHPFLQLQLLEYVIFVVELAMPTTFNRGLLANIGVLEAVRSEVNFSCYVVHDVDLLPVNARNLYVCSDGPRHMSTSNSNYIFKLPYSGYVGGVISFPLAAYKKINGFSNVYFGWGGEDDDLALRINAAGYPIQRVPGDVGLYTAMAHGKDKHNRINSYKYKLLDGAKSRIKIDGFNSVKYKLLKFEKRPLYTWLYVQVNETDYVTPQP